MGMTIWLLTVLLMASLAGLGYRQGAVRVAFSFVGIILGALLAGPLGKLIKPLLSAVGLKNPLISGPIAVLVAFIVISIIFKVVAFTVHQKVDVYFKYKAGDLRLALYERLLHRVGLCLGLFNGAAYMILISWVIYVLGYWTYQTATSDTDPTTLKIVNRLGKDLEITGFHKVVCAIDPLPDSYYQTADVVGLLYNNPLLEARLSRYPAFLDIAETPEIQALAGDQTFSGMRQRRDPVMSLLTYPPVEAIIKNPDLMKDIMTTLKANLSDLKGFLESGRSKYDEEKILGRWQFDLNFTMILLRRAKPNALPNEMTKIKRALAATMSKASFTATPKHRAILKNVPKVMTPAGPATTELQTVQGEWKGADTKYLVTLTGMPGEIAGSIENDRLTMVGAGSEMAFIRED
jgi:hypothetical protein